MEISPIIPKAEAAPSRLGADDPLRIAARALEATFLAEMLKHGGINASPERFGGGAGEDAFASFLTGEYANLLAERGGIGLAEQIFQALAAREARS
jgi:peptidoglycan hydrolase FlgJ